MTVNQPIDSTQARAHAGDAEAQYQLGLRYDNADGVPRDPVAAANWYRFAAGQNHALAQLHLGLIFYAGDVGFERDRAEAARWYLQAAGNGIADAQFNLALMHYNGDGVAQDDVLAFRWFKAAADQGHAKAQFNLGALYANGHGTGQDKVEAYKLWLMAVMQGNPNAHANIAALREKLTAEEADAAQAAVVQWANATLSESGASGSHH